MVENTYKATIENIPAVTEFIDEQLESVGCPLKIQMSFDVAIDELFGNIAHYAYKTETGEATVRFEFDAQTETVSITFIDSGIPFDPLKKADPDITAKAEDRSIGGLGIYMTKKMMDEMLYEYKHDQNILTIRKKISA